ncbi:RagB/SusD family nutrient uptake outer membrane protein [Emticicia sp. CRIBPO]|uniref:RagB/SusD family nutrient uptake outer membrane protein n=1 Tax=Emticicia sp. CRIBPO TaxID=2683258 RepID=UPI0014130730|nr:RagB/SusD family nutrient uptake outer membrane protein [Emticicia sp. CRIBPO]NBA85188.1 RagB/SusD family nutrient uptake outer membrane protein [Emticicia sp. CRIBPO]
MEKKLKYILLGVLTATTVFLTGCKDFLKEEVFSQLAPENYLKTKEGLTSVLYETYAKAANMNSNNSIYVLGPQEFMTDILYQSGDNVEATIRNFREYNWEPNMDFLIQNWDSYYQCIRDANIIIENIPASNLSASEKTLYEAEARFLRAVSYYKLYFFFGPVPLRKSTTQELSLARASDDEIKQFIASELKYAFDNLPNPGSETQKYRAHKAAASAYLVKFYLNTKNWTEAGNASSQFLNSFKNYTLFATYKDMFKVENENNSEYIWVRPAIASSDRLTANSWSNVSFPDNFKSAPEVGLVFKSTWLNWPNEFRIYDKFYNTFDPADKRKDLMITYFINSSDQRVELRGSDNIRSFKYWPDQNHVGAAHGNDIPEIRLADILLSRAEALNELNGPNAEAVQLVNQVRSRAGIGALKLENITSKEAFRDLILLERGHEFFNEGHRRMDLIRTGKFVSDAQARGKNAQPFHVLFPIPQVVIDSDPAIKQNPNY